MWTENSQVRPWTPVTSLVRALAIRPIQPSLANIKAPIKPTIDGSSLVESLRTYTSSQYKSWNRIETKENWRKFEERNAGIWRIASVHTNVEGVVKWENFKHGHIFWGSYPFSWPTTKLKEFISIFSRQKQWVIRSHQ